MARRFQLIGLVAVLSSFAWLNAQDAGKKKEEPLPDKVSYFKHVRPIFQMHCQGCHQPARAKGSYVMTNYADLFKTTDSEIPGIVPRQPDKSSVMHMILPKDGKPPEMPRDKEPLTQREVSLIRTWIVQGAMDDTPASAKAAVIDKEHPPVYEAAARRHRPGLQSGQHVAGRHRLPRSAAAQGRRHRPGRQAHRPLGAGAIPGLLPRRQMAGRQRRRSGPIRRNPDLGRRANRSSRCRCRARTTPSTAYAGRTMAA